MHVAVSTLESDDCLLSELLGGALDDAPPLTREDEFITYYTTGKLPRMTGMLIWLKGQFSLYDRFAFYDMYMYDTRGMQPKRSMLVKVARVMIEHYLMQAFSHWFIADGSSRLPCDMGKVLDKLVDLDAVSSIIFAENRT